MRLCLAIALVLGFGFGGVAAAKELPPLPNRVEVAIDARTAAALHARAVARFGDAFRPDRLRHVLEALREQPDHAGDELRTTLKELRKHGAILRSSFQALDAGHRAPRALDRFVRVFGKLNDALDNRVDDEVAHQAKRLAGLLEARPLGALERSLTAFRATDKAAFDAYVEASLTQLHGAVDHDELPAEAFHRVRKSLKNLLAVVQLLEDSPDETKRTHATYEHLLALNDRLGEAHDAIVRRDLHGKADYDEVRVRVPDSVKSSIAALRERFRNVAPE